MDEEEEEKEATVEYDGYAILFARDQRVRYGR